MHAYVFSYHAVGVDMIAVRWSLTKKSLMHVCSVKARMR